MKPLCPFCKINKTKIIAENNTIVAIADKFPVTKHHVLLLPKKHRHTYFDLSKNEAMDMHELLYQTKTILSHKDPTINGFNIGANCGESAGQTVAHCHMHLIPRRAGDLDNPAGGVRGVIPEKRIYSLL